MISIIGAGPVGSYLGYLLAKNGKEVSIFEEHDKVGEPVQCTGIVSKNLAKIIDVKDEFTINRVYGAEIYAPNKSSLNVRKQQVQAFILDRKKFDKYWLKMAEKAGCDVFLGEKFVGFKEDKALFKSGKKVKTYMLIGADGPLSSVAKAAGLSRNRFLQGIQARIKQDTDKDLAKLYLGSVAPGFFAWSVPEGDGISRVGLAAKNNANKYFEKFVSKENIIEIQAGLIPIYDPNKRIQHKNVYLVGDAAGQIKATTGGGIIMGFLAAQQLVKSIATGRGRDYAKLCNDKIGRELKLTLMIRKYLNKMSDNDCNKLISLFNKGKARKALERYGDMDFPSRFLFKLLLAEPRFLQFAKLVFR